MQKSEVMTLNESDIISMTAEKYHVDEKDVSIIVSNGDPQYPKQSVYITIKKVGI